MRALVIAERYPPDLGGVARSAERTSASLRLLGLEVDVLSLTRALPPGALETEPREREAVVVHRLGAFSHADLSLQHAFNVVQWLARDRPYGLLWGHYLFPAGFAAVLYAKQLGLPVTVSARGNDVDQLMFPPGDFARLCWTLERAGVITAASRDLARKIDVLLGRDAGVLVVPNAVDPDLFSPGEPDRELRAALGIEPGEAVLGFAGELRHKKGFPFMLEALCTVRRQRPACLLVMGEVRGRELPHLQTFAAAEPRAAERILLTGPIEDRGRMAACYRLCDLYLQPSVWDGLPNSLLEAMACGRLVLCSDAGGIPEVVVHGVSGFMLPRAELHQLGTAATELLALSPEAKAAYGRAARARVLERHHPGLEHQALGAALDRLVPGWRGERGGAAAGRG
jgi:glycosyltransferase involved in cell wall biosynthesis